MGLRMNLTSVSSVEFLTKMLPVAQSVRSQAEVRAFEQLVNTIGRRLLEQYPGQRDDLIAVRDALEGTAQAMVDNAMEVKK